MKQCMGSISAWGTCVNWDKAMLQENGWLPDPGGSSQDCGVALLAGLITQKWVGHTSSFLQTTEHISYGVTRNKQHSPPSTHHPPCFIQAPCHSKICFLINAGQLAAVKTL